MNVRMRTVGVENNVSENRLFVSRVLIYTKGDVEEAVRSIKQSQGLRGGKTTYPIVLLPKLKKSTRKKKHHYKLSFGAKKRRKAIDEGVMYEYKHMNKTKKQAATAKKGRLNILRIYRRKRNLKDCNKITADMKYIDRKYKLGKTTNICGKSPKNRTQKKR